MCSKSVGVELFLALNDTELIGGKKTDPVRDETAPSRRKTNVYTETTVTATDKLTK